MTIVASASSSTVTALMFGAPIIIVGIIIAYTGWLLREQGQDLKNEGLATVTSPHSNTGYRSVIVDRNGLTLASSVPIDMILIRPSQLRKTDPRVELLASILNRETSTILNAGKNTRSSEVDSLIENISREKAQQIEGLGLAGVVVFTQAERFYPYGESSVHVVGYTDKDGKGLTGVESFYDSDLKVETSRDLVIKDQQGVARRVLRQNLQWEEPKKLILSIDQNLQRLALSKLKAVSKGFQAKSASIILIDIDTTELLVLTNYPAFDPNGITRFNLPSLANPMRENNPEAGTLIENLLASIFTDVETSDANQDQVIENNVQQANVLRHYYLRGLRKNNLDLNQDKQMLTTPDNNSTWLDLAHLYTVIANDGIYSQLSIVRSDVQKSSLQSIISPQVARSKVDLMHKSLSKQFADLTDSFPYKIAGQVDVIEKSTAASGRKNNTFVFTGVVSVTQPGIVVLALIDEPAIDNAEYGKRMIAEFVFDFMNSALRVAQISPDKPSLAIDTNTITGVTGG